MRDIDRKYSNVVSGAWMENISKKLDDTAKPFKNYNTLDQYHLFTYASAISSTDLSKLTLILPASQLVVETYSDNTVKAFLND